jgi:hypothetical protein
MGTRPDNRQVTSYLTPAEFKAMFASFETEAFRFEAQPQYPLGPGQEDFDRFLAGTPTPPTEYTWLAPWLEELAQFMSAGKSICRVRVLDEPMTDYQRWMLWGAPWMVSAGEYITYMSRSAAGQAGLPGYDWWLFDDSWVVEMHFAPGEVGDLMLVSGTQAVDKYRALREAALLSATTVARATA